MDKWDYIRLISSRGDRYGYQGGVYDLLEWCKKENTTLVTAQEAKEFWEHWPHSKCEDIDMRNDNETK